LTAKPWFKFCPSDWRGDPKLQSCSLAARGLWIEMLAVMHEADPRGHLLINAKQVSVEQLSRLIGTPVEQVSELLSELSDAGVFDRRKNGVIVSRRMERDEEKARKNRENGELGGNPSLLKQREKSKSVNHKVKAQIPDTRDQIEEREAKASPKKRRTTLPEEWVLPDDWIDPAEAYANTKGYIGCFNWREEGGRFHAHHRSRGSPMLDWSAAWKTWYVNAVRFYENGNRNRSQQKQSGQPGDIVAALRLCLTEGTDK